MALAYAPANLGQHRVRGPAARPASDERDHAEGARERAAVLDPDERPHAIEAVWGVDAADRPDVARDECRPRPHRCAG